MAIQESISLCLSSCDTGLALTTQKLFFGSWEEGAAKLSPAAHTLLPAKVLSLIKERTDVS